MRLRNIRGSKEAIEVNKYVIQEPSEMRGTWKNLFNNDNPIQIEIGMGKGRFISELAIQNPHINYVGIEKYSSVLIRAVEKRSEMECDNLYLLRMEAENITNVFGENEVDRIYLNFSDPWPKDRHAKRRLTSAEFLKRYEQILKKESLLIFKTDNKELFDFSVNQAAVSGWKVVEINYDLHKMGNPEGNIVTEYENNFVSLGHPICRMIIKVA